MPSISANTFSTGNTTPCSISEGEAPTCTNRTCTTSTLNSGNTSFLILKEVTMPPMINANINKFGAMPWLAIQAIGPLFIKDFIARSPQVLPHLKHPLLWWARFYLQNRSISERSYRLLESLFDLTRLDPVAEMQY